jgi:hypothetical protein
MDYLNFNAWNKTRKFFVFSTWLMSSMYALGQTVAINPIKMNVLYIGVDNPVSITASAGGGDKIAVSVSGGDPTVSNSGSGFYNIRVSSVTDECWIKVLVNGKWVGSSSFRVRNLPIPMATIGRFSSGDKIDSDTFKSLSGVSANINDFPFQVEYEVIGFTFSLSNQNCITKLADCQGALFSEQAKEHIAHFLTKGTTVTITNIIVKDPSGKVLKVPSLIYYID